MGTTINMESRPDNSNANEPAFAWIEGTDTIFAGIVFESYLDVNAIIGKEKFCASSDPNICSLLTVGSTSEEILSLIHI